LKVASLFRKLLAVSVSGGLLGIVLWFVPLGEVWRALLRVEPLLLIVGYVLIIAARWPQAIRFCLVAARQGMSITVPQVFKISLAITFYGMFLPGYIAGGAIRWYLLQKADRKPVEAFIIMVFTRTVEVAVTAAVALALALLFAAGQVREPLLLGLSAVALAAVGVQLAMLWPDVARFVLRWLPDTRYHITRWLRETLDKLISASARLRELPALLHLGAWALTCLSLAIEGAALWVFAHALGLGLSLAVCLWLRAALNVILLAPISIQGLGVREATLMLLLGPLAIAQPDIIALSVLLTSGLVVMALCGAVIIGIDALRGTAGAVAPSTGRPAEPPARSR
jgi:glycosyltransferase 2 family protein